MCWVAPRFTVSVMPEAQSSPYEVDVQRTAGRGRHAGGHGVWGQGEARTSLS